MRRRRGTLRGGSRVGTRGRVGIGIGVGVRRERGGDRARSTSYMEKISE